MTLLADLFKFALNRYYPHNTHTIDGTVYLSKNDNYNNWFNSIYINGKWYISEDLSGIVNIVDRSIEQVFLLYDTDTANEYHYGVGIVLKNFRKNHTVDGILDETDVDESTPFVLSSFRDIGSNLMIGGQIFCMKSPESIKLSAPQVINNKTYTQYNAVSSVYYNLFDYENPDFDNSFHKMRYDRFMSNYNEIVSNIELSMKLVKVSSENPDDNLNSGNLLIFKSNGKGNLLIVTEEGSENISVEEDEETNIPYIGDGKLDCVFEYSSGLKIMFCIDDDEEFDWKKVNKYIIDY